MIHEHEMLRSQRARILLHEKAVREGGFRRATLARADWPDVPLSLSCSALHRRIEHAEANASGFRRPAQTNERTQHKHADTRG
jgi:hypothetical protein